jgi:drug/metabolite transporter (DMT)-like permease
MAAISQTSTTIRNAGLSDISLLVFCAMLWGSAFMMMKVAVVEIAPLSVATGRVVIAAIALLTYSLARGRRFPTDLHTWFLLLLVGLFGSGIPFFLITWSEQVIDSGMAAILMSTSPIFALLLAHFFTTDDKFTWFKLAGMAVGFLGVVVVIGVDVFRGIGDNLMPQLATMLAAVCYVFTGVIIRRIRDLGPVMLVSCSLLAASILMVPMTLIIDQPWLLWQGDEIPGAKAIGAIVYLGLVPTAFAFCIRAKLMMTVGYTFFSMAGYLVPVFGVIFGAMFLNEAVEIQALVALLLVLSGVGIAQLKSTVQ